MHILKIPGAYFNEFDPAAAEWLRELIKAGLIAPGVVDERSILDVTADDLRGFVQCHFFAGIGGWSYALRLAGWPDDRPVWTGSPPCQPFSIAGRLEGRNDERHLSPHFIHLVGAARPGMLFGEQVASSKVFGKASKPSRRNAEKPPEWAWLDDLADRLEAARYALGASDFPSAGVGAPHIRQRTYFGAVAHEWLEHASRNGRIEWGTEPSQRGAGIGRGACGLADFDSEGSLPGAQRGIYRGQEGSGSRNGEPERSGAACGLADLHGDGCAETGRGQPEAGCNGPLGDRAAGGLGDCLGSGLEGLGWNGARGREPGRLDAKSHGSVGQASSAVELADLHGDGCAETGRGQPEKKLHGAFGNGASGELDHGCSIGRAPRRGYHAQHDGIVTGAAGEGGERTSPLHGFWAAADWLLCRDEFWRPVESSIFSVADGLPADLVRSGAFVPAAYPLAPKAKDARRVMRLRGYGNAINPHAAALFIQAFDAALIDLDRGDIQPAATSPQPTGQLSLFG